MTAVLKSLLYLCTMLPIAVSATAVSAFPGGSKASGQPVNASDSTPRSERLCPAADTADANRSMIEAAIARSEKKRNPKEEDEEEEEEARRLDCCP